MPAADAGADEIRFNTRPPWLSVSVINDCGTPSS